MGKDRFRRKEAWEFKKQAQGKISHVGGASESSHRVNIHFRVSLFSFFFLFFVFFFLELEGYITIEGKERTVRSFIYEFHLLNLF